MPMNRIRAAFKDKNKKILSLYVMADFPKAESVSQLCKSAQDAGADFLEIGMPFSDPIADGPTIQHSSEVALKNGFTIERLFQQLATIRQQVSIPLILMGYINPVLQYGIERFCADAQRSGIDGVILPDLPVEEYLDKYQALFRSHQLANIFLVTARTSAERIRLLDNNSEGFIYLVSSEATTGGNLSIDNNLELYLSRIAAMKLSNPLVVGFGISDQKSFDTACKYADGAIVASAFLRRLESEGCDFSVVSSFVNQVKGVTP